MFPTKSGVEPTINKESNYVLPLATAEKIRDLIIKYEPEKTVVDFGAVHGNLGVVLGLNNKIGRVIVSPKDDKSASVIKSNIIKYNVDKVVEVVSVNDVLSNAVYVVDMKILPEANVAKIIDILSSSALVIYISNNEYKNNKYQLMEKNGDIYVVKPIIWETKILSYVRGWLLKILEDPDDKTNKKRDEITEKMLAREHQSVWFDAFTHITYDYRNNYEVLEIFGDKALNLAFTQYIRNTPKYRGYISEGSITKLLSYYASKVFQSQLSLRLGLPALIRADTSSNLNISMKEDVLESFIGALSLVGDRIAMGIGELVVYNYVTLIYKDVDIDIKQGYNARSLLNNVYKNNISLLGDPKDKEGAIPKIYTKTGDGWKVEIKIRPPAPTRDIDPSTGRLRRQSEQTLSEATAKSKVGAEEEASKRALEVLDTHLGINSVSEQKLKMLNVYKIDVESLREVQKSITSLGFPAFQIITKAMSGDTSSSRGISIARENGQSLFYMARIRAYNGEYTDPNFRDLAMATGPTEVEAARNVVVKYLRH